MIHRSAGREVIRVDNATIPDIVKLIRYADRHSAKYVGDVQKLVGPTKTSTYKNIWKWVRGNIRYIPDGKKQQIKSPANLYRSGVGDCKSMTIMTGAILQKMCVPYDIVVDFYDSSTPNQGHVYIRTKDGTVIDPVNSRFNVHERVWKRRVYPGNNSCQISGPLNSKLSTLNYMESIASYIEGINETDQKKYSISPINIPYQSMTDGELSIALLERQYRLFSKAYPDLEKKADYLKGVLNHSLSGLEMTIRSDRQLESWVNTKLKDNVPAIAGYYKKARIGQYDTYEMYRTEEIKKCEEIKRRWNATAWIRFAERSRLRNEWESCFRSVQYVGLVNEKFEENAPHLLYRFSGTGKTTQTIATKKVLHNVALENYSAITGISRDNLSLWLRNGIIAQNMKNGAGSKNPENTIAYMLENVPVTQIGNPVVIIPIILAIFKAALAAAQTIIQRMNERDRLKMLANAQGFETESFGPEKEDFFGLESGTISPFLVAAVAALVLLR